jgi:phage terminase large subunit
MLRMKGYKLADLWLPHDSKAKSLQTGRSTVEQFIQEGFPCKVVPKLAVQHGIDAARMILPQCTFHQETCYAGIEALRAYRRQFNERTNQYANSPLHDWASNGSDAFRMFALVTETEVKTKQADTPKPVWTPPEITLDELWKSHESDNWRNSIIRL